MRKTCWNAGARQQFGGALRPMRSIDAWRVVEKVRVSFASVAATGFINNKWWKIKAWSIG